MKTNPLHYWSHSQDSLWGTVWKTPICHLGIPATKCLWMIFRSLRQRKKNKRNKQIYSKAQGYHPQNFILSQKFPVTRKSLALSAVTKLPLVVPNAVVTKPGLKADQTLKREAAVRHTDTPFTVLVIQPLLVDSGTPSLWSIKAAKNREKKYLISMATTFTCFVWLVWVWLVCLPQPNCSWKATYLKNKHGHAPPRDPRHTALGRSTAENWDKQKLTQPTNAHQGYLSEVPS